MAAFASGPGSWRQPGGLLGRGNGCKVRKNTHPISMTSSKKRLESMSVLTASRLDMGDLQVRVVPWPQSLTHTCPRSWKSRRGQWHSYRQGEPAGKQGCMWASNCLWLTAFLQVFHKILTCGHPYQKQTGKRILGKIVWPGPVKTIWSYHPLGTFPRVFNSSILKCHVGNTSAFRFFAIV